jgi:hypothetical protein
LFHMLRTLHHLPPLLPPSPPPSSRVLLQASMRRALPTPALVEDNDTVNSRIKITPEIRGSPTT